MVGAEAMQNALNYILETMPKGEYKPKAKMILGSVRGDIHDLGISIVEAVFQANVIHIYNLGRDNPKEKFVEKAEAEDVDIIGTSALLTGTIFEQKVVVEYLKKLGLRDKYMYLIGGGACPSSEWCDDIKLRFNNGESLLNYYRKCFNDLEGYMNDPIKINVTCYCLMNPTSQAQ